jgi:CubicO group peptidase (beta-lactamase class C family)
MYNNHAYNIAGLVVEKLSGKKWGDFMQERIFEQLGMTRTFTENPDDPNVALPYNILLDRTPFQIPFSGVTSESMMFAGQSVRSSLGDLLRLYRAFLQSMQKVQSLVSNRDAALGVPLQSQQLGMIWRSIHNVLN